MSAEHANDYVLLTEVCTERNCGTRVRYGELTDEANTHWHVRPGIALVPLDSLVTNARLRGRAEAAEVLRESAEQDTSRGGLVRQWMLGIAQQIDDGRVVTPLTILQDAGGNR